MWDFYLAGAESTFRHWDLAVYQIQIAKSLTALPLTRDYMFDAERSMRFSGVARASRANEAA
jgi:cyclopropane-fatty-acyl-phospholipid synthase